MSPDPDALRQAADLLDRDDVYDVAAGAIAGMRLKSREAGECMNAVIAALRTAAAESAT
jgi:hypothetical protein